MAQPRAFLFVSAALLLVAIAVWTTLSATQGEAAPTAVAPDRLEAATPAAAEGPAEPAERREDTASAATQTVLRGRVVDAWGEGVGGALVGDAASARPATTARDGRFELALARGPATVTLLVLARGHAPLLSEHDLPDAASDDVGDLQLLHGGELHGHIANAAGVPLPGAAASLIVLSATSAAIENGLLHAPQVADAAGNYVFSGLAPGSYRVAARAEGHQEATSAVLTVHDRSRTPVETLVLPVGHRLAGVVLGADTVPVAGANVRVRLRTSQARYDGSAVTSNDGRFAFDAVPPGAMRVEVDKKGCLRAVVDGVDAARGEEVIVRLAAGLRIRGVVVDGRSGKPVEVYATSIRRVGDVAPGAVGTVPQQLRQQIETARAAAASAQSQEEQARQLRFATEFEGRLARLDRETATRPLPVPTDLGPAASHPQGVFVFDGLEEGVYAVGVWSPEHQWAQQEPIVVQVGSAAPELRIVLVAGHLVRGVVVAANANEPVKGAIVSLLRVPDDEPAADDTQRSLFPWLFARKPPRGVEVMTAPSRKDGSFTFAHTPPGRYVVAVRHADFADFDSAPFSSTAGRPLRIEIGERAALVGRVVNVPASLHGKVSLLVLGGHGTLRTVKVAEDGTFRCGGLQPGSYLVRAFPTAAKDYVRRLFGELFPEAAANVDPDKLPPRDVALSAGEVRTLEVALDVPPTGSVTGSVAINGAAVRDSWVVLRPVAGEAPGSGGLSLRGSADAAGSFAIADVPAGNYTLVVLGPGRWQELHREPVRVAAGEVRTVSLAVAAGGLRGRITSADGAPAAELRGFLWILPGATEAPADTYVHGKSHRVHRVSVQNGAFEETMLTPGPALVLIDLRGRQRAVARVTVPKAAVEAVDFTAGVR